jgi:excisionase family DNA binding protein
MTDERRYVTVREAATRLSVSEATMRRMVRAKLVEYVRTSPRGHYRISVDSDGRPVVLETT